MRRVLVLAAVVALTLATFGGAALAVVKDGGPGPDRLVGTVENDILRGHGGADEIIGKGDSDRLPGGRGNDFINARERGRAEGDFVDCGAGRDTVLTDSTTEDTLRNCEDVRRGSNSHPGGIRRRGLVAPAFFLSLFTHLPGRDILRSSSLVRLVGQRPQPWVVRWPKQARREVRVDEPPTTTGEDPKLPGLRGVDHVGITVPDIERATAFFVDVLGCELLYEREPPRDDSPRDRLGVPAGSRIRAVRFLRCANGANIELFEFYSPDQREDFPRPSDVGIQHLAFYVDDLDAAAEHVRRQGVNLLSGPNPLPGPEAGEGNRFIYARTPWGLTLELISYPAPMAYQQHSDARRWRPPPIDR